MFRLFTVLFVLIRYYASLPRELILRFYDAFRVDFEMFDYSINDILVKAGYETINELENVYPWCDIRLFASLKRKMGVFGNYFESKETIGLKLFWSSLWFSIGTSLLRRSSKAYSRLICSRNRNSVKHSTHHWFALWKKRNSSLKGKSK